MEAALETALSDHRRATDQLGEAQARQLQHHVVSQQQQQRSHHSGIQLNEYSSSVQSAGLVSPVWGKAAARDDRVTEQINRCREGNVELESLRRQLGVVQEECEIVRASVHQERDARVAAGALCLRRMLGLIHVLVEKETEAAQDALQVPQ